MYVAGEAPNRNAMSFPPLAYPKPWPPPEYESEQDRLGWGLNSRRMVEAIRKAGGQPTYHEYPGVGHSCWDRTYVRTDLYEWLLMQKRH